jgi:predicted nucleic acid-binding protein
MKRIVFDSYAVIALFREETGFEVVRDLLVQISHNKAEGYITTVNAGEVYYMISRKSNSKYAEDALDALLQLPILLIDADLSLSTEAAKIKSRFSLSYADAYAAALSILKKATLITGDKEFENLIDLREFKVMYF